MIQEQPKCPSWLLPVVVVLSAVAGFVAEIVINDNKQRFWTDEPGLPPFPPEYIIEQMWNQIYNHIIGFGFLGAILCGVLCMAAGAAASPARGILGFVLGSVLGLVAGAATGVLGHFTQQNLQQIDIEGILKAIAIYSPVWVGLAIATNVLSVILIGSSKLIGRGVGMAIGLGILAAVISPVLTSVVFPVSWPGAIIPENYGPRLTAYLMGTVFVGLSLIATLTVKATVSSEQDAESESE